MAVRRTLLVLGDLSAAGQIPVASLTSINASYADPQADFQIWDTQDQAWETLTPGVNSNPTFTGTDFWGLESRLRAGIATYYPTGTWYCIKHTPSSTLSDWLSGTAASGLITQVTNAAAAANLAGDTLSIDGIVISLITGDFLLSSWRSVGPMFRQWIAKLRVDLEAVPSCNMGTVRNDGLLTPVVVIEPHYQFAGLTDAQKGQLFMVRTAIEALENADERISVLRSHRYTAYLSQTFDAQSMVNQGTDAGARLWPEVFNDGANTAARVVCILGDSTAEGWLTNNALLPAHQQAALTGANIWRPDTGQLVTLQASVNNLISVPSSPFTGHGFEINLGDRFRSLAPVYIAKGTQISSTASDYRGLLGSPTPPHQQRTPVRWSDGPEQLQQMHIRGTLVNVFEAMRKQSLKPELELVLISLGLNDTYYDGAIAENVIWTIRSMMQLIKRICDDRGINRSALKFVVMVPPNYAVNALPPFSSDAERLNLIREAILALPIAEQDVAVVDFSDHEAGPDSYHPSTAGVRTAGDAIWEAWNNTDTVTVEPIFAPSIDYLRSALRLSQLHPDNDVVDIVDNAVLHARARLYRELGEVRIDSLRKISFVRSPKTADDYLRIMASDTEIKIVRAQLIRVLPLVFKDGSSQMEMWNQEAAFREGSYLQTKDELRRLEEEIVSNLQVLLVADLTKYASGGIETIGPDGDNPRPGDTVFGVF